MPRKTAKEKILGVSTKVVTVPAQNERNSSPDFDAFKKYIGSIHNQKYVPSDRVQRFRNESYEYLSTIPQQDQLMILEWTDVFDQIVNYRLQGYDWASILQKDFGSKSMEDAVSGNLYGYDCFLSAVGRKFLDQTDWQKSLSAQDKQFIQRLLKVQVFNQTEAKAFFDLETSNIKAQWGEDFWRCVMAYDEYQDPFKLVLMYWSWTQYKPKKFVKHGNLSQDARSCRHAFLNGNSVGPFDEALMNKILDQSVLDLGIIFSQGPTLKEPITIYRGLKGNAPDDRQSFRSVSTDIVNAIGYVNGKSCCLMIIHVHPGVKTFEFSKMLRKPITDEHEVLIPPTANLKQRSSRYFSPSEWPEIAKEYAQNIYAYEQDWFP